MRRFADTIGVTNISHFDSPLSKIEQLAQYDVIGSPHQQAAYMAYLKLWKLRYLILHQAVILDDKARLAETAFIKQIHENLALSEQQDHISEDEAAEAIHSVA